MVWALSLSTTKLIPRSLTPVVPHTAFRVSNGLVSLSPLSKTVLYRHMLFSQGYT